MNETGEKRSTRVYKMMPRSELLAIDVWRTPAARPSDTGRGNSAPDRTRARCEHAEMQKATHGQTNVSADRAVRVTDAYQQDFFCCSAARGSWKREARVHKNGTVVARLPYVIYHKGLQLFGGCLPWAHLSELTVDPSLDQTAKAIVLRQLLDQLPRWVYLRFSFDSRNDDRLLLRSFKDAGFLCFLEKAYWTTPNDPDVMDPTNKHGMAKKRRDSIKCAARKVTIVNDVTVGDFVKFYGKNLKEQGKIWYDDPFILRDILASGIKASVVGNSESKCIEIYAAKTNRDYGAVKQGTAIAMAACLFDSRRCYYWLSSRLPISGFSDTIETLILHAARQAKERGVIFDADRLDTEGRLKLFERLKFPHSGYRNVFVRSNHDSLYYRLGKPIQHLLLRYRVTPSTAAE